MKQLEQRKRPTKDGGARRAQAPRRQTGGTLIGFIVGVVVGLVAALALAVYVTKVPIPFLGGKTQGRNADHDAAESRKNQNWDPNAPLYGKNPARPAAPAPAPAPAVVAPGLPPPVEPSAPSEPAAARPGAATAATRPAPSSDPLGDLARARSATPAPAAPAAPAADPFEYFIQAGAFRTPEDAEAQRARLAMMGLEARVTEREQAGRTIYRVRMGPYKNRDDAERTKDRLSDSGSDTALVRVQR
jgi:cell division protein FtsN